MSSIIIALLIPLLGTILGSAFVFVMRKEMPARCKGISLRFGGNGGSIRMVAIDPFDRDGKRQDGHCSCGGRAPARLCIPSAHRLYNPHIHARAAVWRAQERASKTAKLALAVTIHNFPEGMAVGVAITGAILSFQHCRCFGLSVGIAIQISRRVLSSLCLCASPVTASGARS